MDINVRKVNTGHIITDMVLESGLRKNGLIDPPVELKELLHKVDSEYDLTGLHIVNFYRSTVKAAENGVFGRLPTGESVYLVRGQTHPLSEGIHHICKHSRDAIINIGIGYVYADAKHTLLHELAHHLVPSYSGKHTVDWMVKNLELQEKYVGSTLYAISRETSYLGAWIVRSALGTLSELGASR